MKIVGHDTLRIYPHTNEGFFDIFPLEYSFGVELICFDSFSYRIVIGIDNGIKILIFEHKEYFENWLKIMETSREELNIIYEGGKDGKRE